MQQLQKCEEEAEIILQTASNRPEKLLTSSSPPTKWKSLHQKLQDLYVEESRRTTHDKKLKCCSQLLEKLVRRDQLNTLVVNLYAGNEGFSLLLRGKTGQNNETIKLPYEESELLECIDNEELPAMLVDLLDRVQMNLFYSGCVICEVRDYRRAVNNSYLSKFVLLKPSQQSLQCDLNTLTNDGHLWTQEDRHALESQLLLATAEPLCLDPSPTVLFIRNKLQADKYRLHTHAIRRSVRKSSQATLNKKNTMSHTSAPPYLKLHDFVTKKRDKVKGAPAVNLRVGKSCVDMWRQRDVPLVTPHDIDVLKYARHLERSKLTMDNTPIIVEEYTFESERGQGKVNFSKLTVLKRVSDEFYLGELYVDRDFQEGQSTGSTCKFPLGTKANVEKYLKQFREIFTEEGRRQVKITHQMQGHNPSVSFSPATAPSSGGGQNTTAAGTASAQAMLAQAANLAATLTGQINIPGAGGDVKRPIKLSLSINPSVSTGGTSTSQPVTVTTGQQNNPTAQITLSLAQQQQLAANQRVRQALASSSHRSSSAPSTPNVSASSAASPAPATTASVMLTPTRGGGGVVVGGQQTLQLANQPPFSKTLSQSATPPPNITITMANSIPVARRPSNTEPLGGSSRVECSSAPPGLPVTQVSADPSGTANQILAAMSTSGNMPPTLNVVPSSAVPQNINIQNITGLQGVNIANLSALQNIQVTVSGVQGGIAVPLSLLNTGSHGNVLLSPTSSGSVTSTVTAASSMQIGAQRISSAHEMSDSHKTPVKSAIPVQVTLPHNTPPGGPGTSVISSPPGMLSLPIGVAGNITQFMTAKGLKGTQGTGIRPGTPLLLQQVPGQQPLQLLSTGLPQGTRFQLNQQPPTPGKQPLPQSPSAVNTGLLSPPPAHYPSHHQASLHSPLGAYSPLRPGQCVGQPLQQSPQQVHPQQPQFLHLTPQQSMTHLTIQGGAAVLTPSKQRKLSKM